MLDRTWTDEEQRAVRGLKHVAGGKLLVLWCEEQGEHFKRKLVILNPTDSVAVAKAQASVHIYQSIANRIMEVEDGEEDEGTV